MTLFISKPYRLRKKTRSLSKAPHLLSFNSADPFRSNIFPALSILAGALLLSTDLIAESLLPAISVSASASLRSANLAVDGDLSTRWESVHGSGQSELVIDLGEQYALTRTSIDWEAANAKSYVVQGSNDQVNWATLASVNNGVFGNRVDDLNLSGNYQFVKVLSSSRSDGNQWGYSIWEIEIFGDETDTEAANFPQRLLLRNLGTQEFIRSSTSLLNGSAETTSNANNTFTQWNLTPNGDYYHIENADTGYRIRPINDSDSSELYMVPNGWSGSWTQWQLEKIDDSYRIINRRTGKYIRPRSGSDKTMIQVPTSYSGTWTRYEIIESDAPTPTPPPSPTPTPTPTPNEGTPPPAELSYTPLFNENYPAAESQNYRTEADGTIVTFGSGRGRSRHESENSFYTFPTHYFEHRTFAFEIHDNVRNGASTIEIYYEPEFAHFQRPECRSSYKNMWRSDFNNNSRFQEMKVANADANGRGEKWVCIITRDAQDGYDEDLAVGNWMEVEFQQFLGRFEGDPEVSGQTVYYTDTYRFKIGEPGIYIVGDSALEDDIRTGGAATAPFVNAGGVVQPSNVISATPTMLTYRDSQGDIQTDPILDGNEIYSAYVVDDQAAVWTSFFREALNIRWDTHNDFLNGRRVFHTRFDSGIHAEPGNPDFPELAGLASDLLVNTSCIDCHINNGRGPSMSNAASSLTRSVKLGSGDLDSRGQPIAHNYFGSLLQNRSNDSGIASEGSLNVSYSNINGTFSDGRTYQLTNPSYNLNISDTAGGTVPYFSPRMPQTITGLGLLEAISDDDIAENHDPLDSDGDGISGRVSLVLDTESGEQKIGRFGWKGTHVSLKHFTASALNQDIGVNTSVLPNADCGVSQTNCINRSAQGAELNDKLLNELVIYLQALGAPSRRPDEVNQTSVREGEQIFAELNCGSCHTPTMTTSYSHPLAELRGQTIRAYTDLLLHDMGDALADNISNSGQYNREWRTPPLWGLGLTEAVNGHTNLLHDGRARNIEEAILWHGGEAQSSTDAYKRLNLNDRNDLLEFLNSL